MYRITFFLFIFLGVNLTPIHAQELSENQRLGATAKVWGFLKYYHPKVARGKFDWDAELLKILPKVEQTKTKETFSQTLLDWVNGLGEVPICKKCDEDNQTDYFDKNFDLSWIKDTEIFTKELSDKLGFIEKNRNQGKQHYVSVKHKQVGNITLENEPEYADLDWQDANMRLLIGFKYWNIIEYFFPYKYQTDEPWGEVLLEAIPTLKSASTEKEFHDALLKMVVKIDDSHGWFVTTTHNYTWPSFKTNFVEDKLVVTGFYESSQELQTPLEKGDVILAIDNEPVENLLLEGMEYTWGSNKISKLRNLNYRIVRSLEEGERTIKFQRNGQVREEEAKYYPRDILHSSFKEKWKMLPNNIGYVNMGEIVVDDVKKIMDSLMQTKAIIFDIRNYPKGTMYHVGAYLNSERRNFYKTIQPDLNYPGKFKWTDGGEVGSLRPKEIYQGKIILMVNEDTQSHAEFSTMALQTADNVVTIGSQTAGADGNISYINLGGDIRTCMSGMGIFYPDGTETQRRGVKIDVEVHPTLKGIKENRDEVLEKAIEIAED
ncbi:S41 family peptidase [Flagellimonas iocasae]|uniref:S41 family peptidase n=1 Tax=Flagellimonas iocasae TaxID=2055905 RepID=A0ABW4XYM4_9FLAO